MPRGFSLIEYPVATGMMATLLGKLLPALQCARATAARTRCSNNFNQFSLASQHFHDQFQEFPAALLIPNEPNDGPWPDPQMPIVGLRVGRDTGVDGSRQP